MKQCIVLICCAIIGFWTPMAFGEVASTITDGESRTFTAETNEMGMITTITDPAGFASEVERDNEGNPLRVTLASGQAYTFTYDTSGNRFSDVDENINRLITRTFDPKFNLLRTFTDAFNKTTSIQYDAQGNPTNFSSPLNRIIETTSTNTGLPGTMTDSFGTVSYTYHPDGNLKEVIQSPGTTERLESYTYTPEGYIDDITDPLGRVFSFGYDIMGRVTTQVGPDGRTTGYAYDGDGNLTTVTPPGRPAHVFSFTLLNQIAAYTAPDLGGGSTTTIFTYNAAQQVTEVTRADGKIITALYDPAGRLSSLTLPRGQFTYQYDMATGLLASITSPDAVTVTRTYNGVRISSESLAGPVTGTVGRIYNENGEIASLMVNGGNAITYEYDDDSLMTKAGNLTITRDPGHGKISGTTLGVVSDIRTYDEFGELETYTAKVNGIDQYSVQYVRDKLGHIMTQTETIAGVSTLFEYIYDLGGRLTNVKENGTALATYTYDSNGNRLSLTTSGGSLTGMYDQQDRLKAFGNTTYDYTQEGELQSITQNGQSIFYTYDALGNLIDVQGLTVGRIQYHIDGRSRRVGRKLNGQLIQGFIYKDELNPIAELDGMNNLVSLFVYGTQNNVPDYMVKAGVAYRIISDHLGSPRLVVNTVTGAIEQRLDYSAFGMVADTNPGFQPFGYAGGIYDVHTKLIRFGARDYDSAIGRWTLKDPILFAGGSDNLYAYVLNDPTNATDPSGLADICDEQLAFHNKRADFVEFWCRIDCEEEDGFDRGSARRVAKAEGTELIMVGDSCFRKDRFGELGEKAQSEQEICIEICGDEDTERLTQIKSDYKECKKRKVNKRYVKKLREKLNKLKNPKPAKWYPGLDPENAGP